MTPNDSSSPTPPEQRAARTPSNSDANEAPRAEKRAAFGAALLLGIILSSTCLAAPRKETPPIKIPMVEAVEPEITLDDLYKTIEHIQKLAREQQTELDQAKVENESIKKDLGEATENHLRAQSAADTLQVQVNKVTDDRNFQAAEKDRALDQIDVFKVKIDKLTKHIHKLKWFLCSQAAGLCLLLLLWLGLPRLIPIYGALATVAAPGVVFAAVWLLI